MLSQMVPVACLVLNRRHGRGDRVEAFTPGIKMALFLSTFTNRIDKKGRVSVPAPFRAVMTVQEWNGMVAYPSFVDRCVEGCSLNFMERMAAGLEKFPLYSEPYRAFINRVASKSHQLPFDSEGRITIHENLMVHAGIETAVTFVGCARTFQMWRPEAYAEFEATQSEIAYRERDKFLLPSLSPGDPS